ncbi:MAG: prolyl oligopeptidase family serine peptidase [Planctomycetota bacterium]
MSPVFGKLPSALEERTRFVNIGGVPALVAHPDWSTPAPACVWMHGRTVNKELDPGRYLRWLRAGIATVSLDLPGHGQRDGPSGHSPERTLEVISQMVGEIDGVLAGLHGVVPIDPLRLALGGMSAGGMAALRRLCDPHPFKCAAVEGTTGDLCALYFGNADGDQRPWPVDHPREDVAAVDACQHLGTWRPIPLLALHNELDEIVPIGSQRRFISRLEERYRREGADASLITLKTFPESGAPSEHGGFGRFANEAKNTQTAFLAQHLGATPIGEV